jgi:hypothetical protein
LSDEQIDPERLAALLDGRLSAVERDHLLAEIAASGDSYDDLVEASALLTAMSGRSARPSRMEPPDRTVVATLAPRSAAPRRRRLVTYVPVFVAAGIVAVLLVVRHPGSATAPSATDVARTLSLHGPAGANSVASTLGADWDEPGWSATRGASETLLPRARAFRAGARFAELQLALASHDTTAIHVSANSLVPLASEVETGAPVAARAALLARTSGVRPSDQTKVAAELRELFGEPTWFDLGAWSEAARLAARARQAAFFAPDDAAMRSLRHLIVALDRLDPEGRLAAESIVERLRRFEGRPTPSAEQLDALAGALDSTVAEGGR